MESHSGGQSVEWSPQSGSTCDQDPFSGSLYSYSATLNFSPQRITSTTFPIYLSNTVYLLNETGHSIFHAPKTYDG